MVRRLALSRERLHKRLAHRLPAPHPPTMHRLQARRRHVLRLLSASDCAPSRHRLHPYGTIVHFFDAAFFCRKFAPLR